MQNIPLCIDMDPSQFEHNQNDTKIDPKTLKFEYIFLLQGTFSVYEKFRNVEEFVSDSLEHPLPFVLHDNVLGEVCDKEASLIDLGLVPSSILSFAWHPEVAGEVKQQLGPNAAYLKDSILALAKSD